MNHKMPSFALVAALLLTSTPGVAVAQETAKAAPQFAPDPDELFPENIPNEGIVVDTKQDIAYVMTAGGAKFPRRLEDKQSGRIEAIRLENGKAIWRYDKLANPIGIDGAKLVALADSKKKGHLRLIAIDRKSGKASCDLHVKAKGILHNQIDDALQTNLRAHLVEWKGRTYVRWASSFHLVTGMKRRPSPSDHKLVSGLVRFDTKRCAASPIKSGRLPGATKLEKTCAVPGLQKQHGEVTYFADGRGARISGAIDDSPTPKIHHANVWLDGCKVLTEPSPYVQVLFPTGDHIGRVEVEEKDGKNHYTLVRWDATTGAREEDIELDIDDGIQGATFSRDGHFSIVSRVPPETDGAPAKHEWRIYSPTGKELVSFAHMESPHFVVGSKYIVFGTGRVFALEDGKFVTQLSPRNTRYTGPKPP